MGNDDIGIQQKSDYNQKNRAYKQLKEQQQVVEDAIEHLALMHCQDLNGSVVQVGRVARQFDDAVSQVRHLRKQVKEIQETLGAGNAPSSKEQANASAAAASAMSLRELWMKKLEAEAVLALLDKLDRIRAAPLQFDAYLQQHRIGAATIVVAQALDTMFSSDVSQVQALHKIMEQLMMRKQKAEEVVWELLMDVVFLRTGNGKAELLSFGAGRKALENELGKDGDIRRTSAKPVDLFNHSNHGMVNPFLGYSMRFALDYDLQMESLQNPLYLQEINDDAIVEEDFYDDEEDGSVKKASRFVIPQPAMEAEFELESEERRSIDELKYHGGADTKALSRPRYMDHILALRTLVECLVRLRRLDDVERNITEVVERELTALIHREQTRTFLRVEGSTTHNLQRRGRYAMLMSKAGATTDLRDFRKHMASIVSAFGNVQVRLTHLSQIIRHRIKAGNAYSSSSDSSIVMAGVLQHAKGVMERQLKMFHNACLTEVADSPEDSKFSMSSGQSRRKSTVQAKGKNNRSSEVGIVRMGIIDDEEEGTEDTSTWLAPTTSSRLMNNQNLSIPKFIKDVLFAKTTQNGTPQIRHALFFRKALAKWHRDNALLRKELADSTREDTSSPSYSTPVELPALEYLDNVIQKAVLPVLQEEAVNGTVQALERPDAFDPVLDRNVYARADSNEPQDVDMCVACTALYNFTGPLFLALHRLPKGGDMYLPLVAVLEHVILTFISRVKQQVTRICSNQTALQLLMDSSSQYREDSAPKSFGQAMERRKAFAQLVLAYADGDLLEAMSDDRSPGDLSGVSAIPPPIGDTPRVVSDPRAAVLADYGELDFVGGVDREEVNLSIELQFLKPYLEFAGMEENNTVKTCRDEDLMKAACLAHSLLKLSSLLDSRLKMRSQFGVTTKTLANTRALREAIKTIRSNGLKMAKFCRSDVLLQSIVRLAKVCNSSTIVARDAVRIPSSVNDLGEYMTAASDNLREAAGNAVTAYTFSTLEQYIPLCLIQTVRVLAAGQGIVTKAPLTMNGVEALDRSGSVLYRDLKGATSFDNSFWDIELAAVSFERSATFFGMMELEMGELEAYYQDNRNDFSEQDFQLMFTMDGPKRKGDVNRYHTLFKKMERK
ncbi:unnamed protein product [Cylindrotheca closterium]|uniref:Exocyst complex component Sec8 n=1 Tax=Cylindrotheca closterium TaxID=2856 RepID=A0AAD2FUZ3_9STRA|nr:unnamed protein product [Cylindrotheca closterium]